MWWRREKRKIGKRERKRNQTINSRSQEENGLKERTKTAKGWVIDILYAPRLRKCYAQLLRVVILGKDLDERFPSVLKFCMGFCKD